MMVVFSSAVATFSQQVITGKLTTADDPLGIPGVNVFIKGTTNGTVSDLDGNYSLEVPNDSCTLVFSYVGFSTEEIKVKGKTQIDLVLVPDIEAISEVVVTALGIKRDEKALGYSVQKVSGDEVANVKELDVVNALSGKVAGVNIIQGSGDIGGGGSRIVIRGESSLAGNNDPLYIINGIPGAANDVAPDDIESISVLKGSAAAALYGSKAGSGVIMITTKSGKGSSDLRVQVNSSLTFQSPLVLPDYQNSFGQGKGGEYSYYDGNNGGVNDDQNLNWGPAFDGNLRPQFNGNRPWVAYPNNVKDFYQLGHIAINNFSVAKGTDNSSARFSYTNTNQKGIVPNTGLKKNQFDLSSSYTAFKKLTFNTNITYIHTDCPNNVAVNPMFIPRNIDVNALKDYWIPGLEGLQQNNYRRSDNNLYFIAYEQPKGYIDNRTIANFSANLDITDNLTALGRYGIIYTNNDYFEKKAKSSYDKYGWDNNGYYKKGSKNTKEQTAEFLVSYNKRLGPVGTKLSFGGTHWRSEVNEICAEIHELVFLDLYNLNNRDQAAKFPQGNNGYWNIERNSLYGFLNLDYESKIFLDITGRNDWSSTLNPESNSFFYPSAALSAIMSDIVNLPSFFNFWKVRASMAQVGKDIPVAYFIGTDKNEWVDNTNDGSTYTAPLKTKISSDIEPELTTGIEFGSDMRFVNNRLGFDFTYYTSTTVNQILREDVSKSTGYDYWIINAGQISSKGAEVTLNAVPVKMSNGLEWNVQLNWSRDRTYVDELIDSLPDFNKTQKANNFLFIRDAVGQRRGEFYGQGWLRAPDGQQLFSYSGDTRHTPGVIALGNYNPDWMASLYNTVTFRNISFSFLLDYRFGGVLYNETQRKLNFYGLSAETTLNNRTGIVPVGEVEDGNGGYRALTLEDLQTYGVNGQSGEQYWANMSDEGIPECAIVGATYMKLREVRLAYDLPEKLLTKTHVKGVTIAIVGRNLAVWTKVKHIDPEIFGYSSEMSDFGWYSKIPGYDKADGVPSVRNYGFNVKLNF